MKFIPSLVLLGLCAVAANAQVRPTPPTPPAPPSFPTPPAASAPSAAPTPRSAPHALYVPPDYDWSHFGLSFIDAERFRIQSERLAEDMKLRSVDIARISELASERAMENALRAGERAQESALRATERLRDLNWKVDVAPFVELGSKIATTFSNDFAYNYNNHYNYNYDKSFTPNMSFAPLPQARWESGQDQDPADSLYRVAYEAMNRGEYRRSAELFLQVQTKYPRSTRMSTAAYYEASMRYKIGTTDELRNALRVLTDRSKVASASAAVNSEVNSLTTRVRGALAARGDAEQRAIVQRDAQQGGCDKEDMQVRAEALSVLAASDMVAATPMLRRVLDKKDPCSLELRRRALSILLRRADTAATSAAISVAKNNDETLELRVDAVRYLAKLPGDNALSTLEDLMRNSNEREIQRSAMSALVNSENPRARTLVRTLIERSDVSEELRSEGLSSFSRERSTPEDLAYLRNLYGRMQSERLKTNVLSAVSRIGGPENDQFLLTIARNPGEPTDVRSSAIGRLARSTSTVTVADLSKLYDVVESRSLRQQVISALRQRKEPEALDKLIEILKTSTDSSVRNQIINAFGSSTDPRAKAALAEFAGRGQ